jgi:hypothetical protein
MRQNSQVLTWALSVTLWGLTAHAANIAGNWSGVIQIDDSGGKIETPVELSLEQKAGALSGKIGRTNDPERVDIRNAKIDGDKLTFEASSFEHSALMKFSLTIQGDHMRGEMKGMAEGNEIVAKVSFSRAKQLP